MNFVENNGKKVAAVLCVASAIPAVASIAAMETQPGWHGDSYVKKDATVAKGWENVNGQEYYFEEDGTVDEVVSEQASTAAVSSTVASTVENTVVQTTETAVQEENTRIEAEKAAAEQAAAEQAAAEAAAQQAAAEQAAAEQAAAEQAAAEQAAAEQAAAGQTEATVQPAVVEATPTEAVEAQPVVSQPVVEETVVAQPEVSQPVVEQPAAPVQAEQTQPVADNSLGNRIADAAIQLYQSGTTNGWQCTEVATAALRAAGVSASVVWPDQYYAYGTATNNPQAGDLIYYNNGGRGVDHIAVYIGNGQAVHGNYNGQTVIAGAYLPWANTPNFIHVG